MNAYLGADLVTARRARFTAEAEWARTAALVRRRRVRRAAEPTRMGDRLCIRAMEPADVGHLRSLSGRLSMRSRQLRYLAPVRSVSEATLRVLAAVDHENHEALGAFDEGELIAVAHYFRDANAAGRAEISVEVADSHQRRGIGQRLMNDLARLARERGITEFIATASLENHGVLAMVHNSPWPSQVRRSGPELDIAVTLPDTADVPAQRSDVALAPCS
ncbi:MAG TPA: GNAT family N-acetyltransferase [Frankiaceae bacterium]|jgi:GNAT superfamily N-acetyltransferase|nr:GNAT family N-acetyltransferase [Frankiaceae bacterium]